MKAEDKQLPLVSIIIPTYQASKTLKRCLESIFDQEYPRDMMEIIIVDGGSTDGTKNIASRYNVKVINNPQQIQDGPYGGKAIGVRLARGDILCFLDSDNIIWSETWLRAVVQPLVEDNNIAICESSKILDKKDPAINRFCSYYVLDTNTRDPFIPFDKPNDRIVEERWPCYFTYHAIDDLPCLANGSTIRREMLELAGGYDYDADVVIRLANKGHTFFAQSTCGGIHHLYVLSLRELLMKAINRARNFLLRQNQIETSPYFLKRHTSSLVLSVVKAFIPIKKLFFAVQKVHESHDKAWLYYPFASFITTTVYLLIFSMYGKRALRKLMSIG